MRRFNVTRKGSARSLRALQCDPRYTATRLVFCFHCYTDGIIETTARDTMTAHHYHLVLENKNWEDAGWYCRDHFDGALLVVDNKLEELALKEYLNRLNPLHGQFACRLV